jgi:HTH-type transcriptional regulator, sugar sensing transcriptional regulator
MDVAIFEEIGFTAAEAKIYLALLELGPTTAGPVIRMTELQNSVVHVTLQRMIHKGLATFVIKNKTRFYEAVAPAAISKIIEERKMRFDVLLPELLIRQHNKEKQQAEIYLGFQGFKSMLFELIGQAKPKDEYLFFSFFTSSQDDHDNVFLFYKEFEKERKKLGIVVKGIAPASLKDKMIGRDMSGIKFTTAPSLLNISIFNDKVIFTPWEQEKVTFVLTSAQLVRSFKDYFYEVWNGL